MEYVDDKNSSKASNEYKYSITSHGKIFTNNEGAITKYMAINIPKNVEIFTYSNLGEELWSSCTMNYFICDNLDKVKSHNFLMETPIHKYKNIPGKENIFPEVFLTPDKNIILKFYSGIVHCIPKHLITSETKAMEVIYNMDALVKEDCSENTIGKSYKTFGPNSEDNIKLYDTDKQYSTYYKDQLNNYKYDSNSKDTENSVSNKCGPLLLSQAIKVIQAHCEATYPEDCNTSTIKIYLNCCLGTMNIKEHYFNQYYLSILNEEKLKKKLIKMDEEKKIDKRSDEQLDKYYKAMLDIYSLNIKSLINDKLYTTDLQDFDSTKIPQDIEDGYTHTYIYRGIQIKFIIPSNIKIRKYRPEYGKHYQPILRKALDSIVSNLKEWNISINDLPHVINIDLRYIEPTEDDIYNKLLQVIISRKLKCKLVYDFKIDNEKYSVEFHLVYDSDRIVTTLDNTEPFIEKLYEGVKEYILTKKSIFKMVKTYSITLNIYDLKRDNIEMLFIEILTQVGNEANREAKAAEEKASARVKTLEDKQATAEKEATTRAKEQAKEQAKVETTKVETTKVETTKVEPGVKKIRPWWGFSSLRLPLPSLRPRKTTTTTTTRTVRIGGKKISYKSKKYRIRHTRRHTRRHRKNGHS